MWKPRTASAAMTCSGWYHCWYQLAHALPVCGRFSSDLISKTGADGEIRTPGQRFTKPLDVTSRGARMTSWNSFSYRQKPLETAENRPVSGSRSGRDSYVTVKAQSLRRP